MADKKEQRPYLNIGSLGHHENKHTLRESIEKNLQRERLRDDYRYFGYLDVFPKSEKPKEKSSDDEPQGPQMG